MNARIHFLLTKRCTEKSTEVPTLTNSGKNRSCQREKATRTRKSRHPLQKHHIQRCQQHEQRLQPAVRQPIHHSSIRTNRKILNAINKQPLSDAPTVTYQQVKSAIQKAKNSKTYGTDNMSTAHLKHLGPAALSYLIEIFHLSLSKCQIRAIWKSSIIVPLLKPGKDTGLSESYRPVYLLCPASKILEKWLQPTILKHFNFAAHQHGFRSKHSTVTALCDIATAISNGFNKKKPADRTVLVAIDLSKAFDTVKHSKLLELIATPGALKRWLANFLQGRQAKTLFHDFLSEARVDRFGVPQRSVLSPLLFNFYVADAPSPPPDITIKSYADDFTSIIFGTNISEMAGKQTKI